MLVGENARAIRVRENEVVELGEEPRRGGRVLLGPRRLGKIEQLAASLVPESLQARA
jgi:hypothetical protein